MAENSVMPEISPEEMERRRLGARSRVSLPRPDLSWQERAECRSESIELFFGPDGERQPDREIRETKAKKVCMRCPVMAACLDAAIGRNDKAGVWGGLGEDERAMERRRRMRRAAA